MKPKQKECSGCQKPLTELNVSNITGCFCDNCIDLEQEAIINAATHEASQQP